MLYDFNGVNETVIIFILKNLDTVTVILIYFNIPDCVPVTSELAGSSAALVFRSQSVGSLCDWEVTY